MQKRKRSVFSKIYEYILPGNAKKLYVIKNTMPKKFKKISKRQDKIKHLEHEFQISIKSGYYCFDPKTSYTELFGSPMKYYDLDEPHDLCNRSEKLRARAAQKITNAKRKYQLQIDVLYIKALSLRMLGRKK